LHGVTSQETVVLIPGTVKGSNLCKLDFIPYIVKMTT
jgi:hypothetical protein